MWARKYKVDEKKMMEKLWGEHYFDSATRKWSTKHNGSLTCSRGFVHFVYNPIRDLIKSSMTELNHWHRRRAERQVKAGSHPLVSPEKQGRHRTEVDRRQSQNSEPEGASWRGSSEANRRPRRKTRVER
jgi:hypothetical protein